MADKKDAVREVLLELGRGELDEIEGGGEAEVGGSRGGES